MKTELGREYRNALSTSSLRAIQEWTGTAAKALHGRGDASFESDRNAAAAFHADAALFTRLDKALRDLMEGIATTR